MSDQYPQYPKYPGDESPQGGLPPSGQPAAAAPQQPPSIATAVKLMYAGAALTLVSVVISLLTLGTLKDTIEKSVRESDPNASQSTIDAAYTVGIVFAVAVGLIAVGLWLWMARKNGQGRSWARIVATVFGVLNVLFTLISFTQPSAMAVSLVLSVIVAILGVVVLVLLWKKESSQYYGAVTQSNRLS